MDQRVFWTGLCSLHFVYSGGMKRHYSQRLTAGSIFRIGCGMLTLGVRYHLNQINYPGHSSCLYTCQYIVIRNGFSDVCPSIAVLSDSRLSYVSARNSAVPYHLMSERYGRDSSQSKV
ncbi:hypothetical protein BT96DRAFT_656300 [Gymnopus androsaceus JB14]|uniref:Uncharacterized protein n=1 Tax=Gymnopus androsaceus JB14 TaxID=1447944 RepID=A0A6A4HR79_9AGAR|nr:hypothetical protein BT96DRAFT_656300 [Gymnopus androsaceus JB14]